MSSSATPAAVQQAVPRHRARPVWLFPLLASAVVAAVPSLVAGRPVGGQQTTALIQQVLSAPLAYSLPVLLPLAKLLLVAVAALVLAGTAFSPRVLVAYYAVILLVVAAFQNAADLPGRGFAFLLGNAVAQVAVSVLCVLAFRATSATPGPLHRARLWVVPFMLLAAAFSYGHVDGHVTPGVANALTSGAGVTYCMVTAVVAGAMFVRPEAFPAWLRVAVGSVGALYGLMNLLTWFVIVPVSWWMGVLHVPLLVCSLMLLVTSWREARRPWAVVG